MIFVATVRIWLSARLGSGNGTGCGPVTDAGVINRQRATVVMLLNSRLRESGNSELAEPGTAGLPAQLGPAASCRRPARAGR
jgi:hypothetical protein